MELLQTSDSRDEYALIPIDQISEPELPERETMESDDLGELALSIGENGLIQPLSVKPAFGRFEVVAGHRRLLACRIAKLLLVPCIIRHGSAVEHLATLVHENAFREEVNPVEEARFYMRVLKEMCNFDVDLLCLKVRRKRNFVEDRLILLRGHPTVIEALHQKRITIAVARELNKVEQPNRLMLLLDTAITQGATARQVAEWRKESSGQEDFVVTYTNPDDAPGGGAEMVAAYRQECFFCEDGDDPHTMQMLWLHKPCMKMVLKVLGRETPFIAGQA